MQVSKQWIFIRLKPTLNANTMNSHYATAFLNNWSNQESDNRG